jgi:response regulator of citrate/malate metabolism
MKTNTFIENNSPRILIVEDDKTLEPVWSSIASKADKQSQIDWATSELEAEDLIFESMRDGHQYDLVVIDIFLEGQRTGLDLYEKFGHLFHNKMIITSGTDYRNYAEYLSTGSSAPYCIEKPFKPDECLEIIKKMLH